jgi:predicted glycoside hydrolase/deacetylase ChbG (UPF0249 family)
MFSIAILNKSKILSNPRVIINADDFGITNGVNKAIFELVDAGVLTSTSVMSNMPHYEDIVNLKDKIGIGIHFNLTVGKPVTEAYKIPTIVRNNGEFFDLLLLLKKMRQRKVSKQEVEIELNAQIKRLIMLGIQPDHINSHESLLKYPFFMRVIKKIAKEYRIMTIRTYSQRKFDYTRLLSPRKTMISLFLAFQKIKWELDGFHVADKYDSLLKLGLDYEAAIKKLKNIFCNLPQGVLEMVTHPGYCDGNNEILGEYIYEREVETKALLSSEFKELIVNFGVELIDFRDI